MTSSPSPSPCAASVIVIVIASLLDISAVCVCHIAEHDGGPADRGDGQESHVDE